MQRKSDKTSSILDDVPVVNQAFKSFPDYQGNFTFSSPGAALEVVAHCPTCQNPIYGPKTVAAGQMPQVQRTCACLPIPPQGRKDIRDTMRTT